MRIAFLFALILPVLAFAQDPVPASLDNPVGYITMLFNAVSSGRWPEVGWIVLVLLVIGLRMFGQKIHDFIPDDNWADKPFWFLLETKPGMWILNVLTAIGGGIGTALIAVGPAAVNWALVRPMLTAAIAGAGVWTLIAETIAMFRKKDVPNTVAAAKAGAAAAEAPPAVGLAR